MLRVASQWLELTGRTFETSIERGGQIYLAENGREIIIRVQKIGRRKYRQLQWFAKGTIQSFGVNSYLTFLFFAFTNRVADGHRLEDITMEDI